MRDAGSGVVSDGQVRNPLIFLTFLGGKILEVDSQKKNMQRVHIDYVADPPASGSKEAQSGPLTCIEQVTVSSVVRLWSISTTD